MNADTHPVIAYTNNHRCEPTRTGDYDFICPTLGRPYVFIPYLLRRQLHGVCKCGLYIEPVESPN